MKYLEKLKTKHYSGEKIGGPLGGLSNENSSDKSIENNASFGERLVFIITICLKYLILLAGIVLLILLLPIIPFLWVSYKGFHGKYGIIKLFRENFNVYQL